MRLGPRGRLAIAFALAVAAALALFSGVVLLVLERDAAAELAEATRGEDGARGEGPDAEAADAVRKVGVAMALAAPVVIACAAGLGLWLSRRALAPLREASERARSARHSALDLTLPVRGVGDEWDDLAGTLNELLADARASVSRIRRFTADAAHELRTPLTAILGEAEVALRRDRPPAELRDSVATIHEEALRLARLLEALLVLARADAGTLLSSAEPLDLALVLGEARDRSLLRARKLSPAAELDLEGHRGLDGPGAAIPLRGNAVLLSRALENLFDNALRHGGGRARASLSLSGGQATVLVADDGPGIAPALRPALFERFVRGDASRASEGLGLGLAIARAIAAAHGGTLELVETARGATFALQLPVA